MSCSEKKFLDEYPYITPKAIEEELFGIPLVSKTKQPLPTSVIEEKVRYAISEIETNFAIKLKPTRISARKERIEGFDLYEEPYDYRPSDYQNWAFLQLREFPVISVERYALVTPDSAGVLDLTRWVHLNPEMGHIRIVPGTAMFSGPYMNAAGIFMPFGRSVPGVIEVDYTAGYTADRVLGDHALTTAILRIAAFETLKIVAQSHGPVANVSASIDGLSKSVSFGQMGPYSGRLEELKTWIDEFYAKERAYYKGFTLA